MAKKKKKQGDDFEFEERSSLRKETVKVIYGLVFLICAIFIILAAFSKAGVVGTATYQGLDFLLGVGYFILPVILLFLGIIFLTSMKKTIGWLKVISAFVVLLSALSLISVFFKDHTGQGLGGFLGNTVSIPLMRLFDFWATSIILSGILLISLIITVETHINWEKLSWKQKDKELTDENKDTFKDEFEKKPKKEGAEEATIVDDEEEKKEEVKPLKKIFGLEKTEKPKEEFEVATTRFLGKEYTPPPLNLLEQDRGKPGVGDIKANANIIKRTLQNFGINVEMDEISIGPSVTRYALKPAEGMKLSRIVGLQNDLALALAAHPIRIEAPIPGKSLVGIEIPNTTKTTVGLGSLLSGGEFKESDKPLLVALGRGISGKSHFGNLAKMPHLLIAGATGSGKSVTIHTILTSLLYRNSPENLKFIMIDPKRVELTQYNNIPHLLTPVITEAKKSILSLKWAAKEMDRRYDILEAEKVRDIESYHKTILGPAIKKHSDNKDDETPLPEIMPYIVVVIDELADLMQAYPRELESAIVRLAQMSRAVGIHLILSTQRPSVNVITGLIKANVPSRIALQVTSQIDSRTILDTGGAEKLLGAGDMLYMSGEMSKPVRLQSAYISEKEMKAVVKYLIDAYADTLPNEINLTEGGMDKNAIFEASLSDDGADEDDLYEEAKDAVLKAGKASTSYLQRKLRVGYARAARLIDMLEERGVVGAGEGAKPREVMGASGAVETEAVDETEPVTEETL